MLLFVAEHNSCSGPAQTLQVEQPVVKVLTASGCCRMFGLAHLCSCQLLTVCLLTACLKLPLLCARVSYAGE